MSADPAVWWDSLHRHYGWTCPGCGGSGVNLSSTDAAQYGLAAHRQTCATSDPSQEATAPS